MNLSALGPSLRLSRCKDLQHKVITADNHNLYLGHIKRKKVAF